MVGVFIGWSVMSEILRVITGIVAAPAPCFCLLSTDHAILVHLKNLHHDRMIDHDDSVS